MMNRMVALEEKVKGPPQSPFISAKSFKLIHFVGVEIYNWISKEFDLLVALDDKSRGHSADDTSSGNHECEPISCQQRAIGWASSKSVAVYNSF